MVWLKHRQSKTNTRPDEVNAGGKNRPVLLLSGHALEMFGKMHKLNVGTFYEGSQNW